jgi:predicted Rossmann fold flavoprotein
VSGPVVLDVSRDYLRAALEGGSPALEANLLPGRDFAWVDQGLVRLAAEAPRTSVARALARQLPQAVAEALAVEAGCGEVTLGRLGREERRTLVHGIVERRLRVAGDRGYSFAEVTAGGVPLAEVDTATMESKRQGGLFLVGEMLDVDGRIGGFNFQWAWSSGWVAGGGLARVL